MASVQDLKRRTRSVRNTSKITKALELVASARLRRAQSRIEAMRPYAETMRELMGDDVVNQRVRCATLALGTVQAAIEERKRQDARDVVAARTASTES